MYNGIEDSMVVQGPLYLIKIKENGKYGARDLLWAIGQKMEEPLNFGGMKSLVEDINKKGLYTPKLVEHGASKTWGEVLYFCVSLIFDRSVRRLQPDHEFGVLAIERGVFHAWSYQPDQAE